VSILIELRRRNVFKVGAAYAIVAWLLIQIADVILPTFNSPEWVMQVFTFLMILGLPVALLLAWAYEMTPGGVKREGVAESGGRVAPATGQRLNYFIVGVLVLAVGFLVTDQYIFDQLTQANVADTNSSSLPGTNEQTRPSASNSIPLRRSVFDAGTTVGLGRAGVSAEVAVSPDGKSIVYSANVDGQGIQLHTRSLDQFESLPIPGTENARQPFFSPDGEWLGFHTGFGPGSVVGFEKISVRGGPSQLLTPLTQRAFGASWGPYDTIIFSSTEGGSADHGYLVRIPSAGGEAEVLTTPDPGTSHVWPHILPGGQSVLFTIREINSPPDQGTIAILSLDGREYRPLIQGAISARYVPTGHIVFARSETLWAVPFDLDRQEITGDAAPLVEGVHMGNLGFVPYGISDNGVLSYVRGVDITTTDQGRNLIWIDRYGRETPLDVDPQLYSTVRLSPDGTRLAVHIAPVPGEAADVWIYDLTRGTSSRLTFDPANDYFPIWTPDSQSIVFGSSRDGFGLYMKSANGIGSVERLTQSPYPQVPESFSPDGTRLLFRATTESGRDLYLLSMEGERTEKPLLTTSFHEGISAFSPDGRWVAYESNETGRNEIYVRPFPDFDGGKWQVSRDGGRDPVWGPDGAEIFFRTVGGEIDPGMRVVKVQAQETFLAGVPEVVFSADLNFTFRAAYDIAPTGDRFVAMKNPTEGQTTESGATSIAIVENWFSELQRISPAVE
jgi:serine/threonine-protein kinase